MNSTMKHYHIAVLLPCYNEATTIGQVVKNFREVMPESSIYVYDNNSTDDTVRVAREAGAIVRSEPFQGKGNVVRRMFADIEADVYVLADGDETYDAASAPKLVSRLIRNKLDMVAASRISTATEAYRPAHQFGNRFLSGLVAWLFGNRFRDLLTGYRAFSRRFVKSFPALSWGFEIETELTVHALELRMPADEIDTPYHARPAGSTSKLNTWRDGLRILLTILRMLKEVRPMFFFSSIAATPALLSLILAWPLFVTYFETGLVPRFPTAILSTGLMSVAFVIMVCGIILDSVTRGRQEMKRMSYLNIPSLECRRGEEREDQ
jgi:glycosyltransferase involved in cell wall biosynthesis